MTNWLHFFLFYDFFIYLNVKVNSIKIIRTRSSCFSVFLRINTWNKDYVANHKFKKKTLISYSRRSSSSSK